MVIILCWLLVWYSEPHTHASRKKNSNQLLSISIGSRVEVQQQKQQEAKSSSLNASTVPFIHSFIHCALGCSGLHRALSSFSFLPFQTICSIRAATNGNVNAVLYIQTNIAMAEQWRWGAYGEWESRKRLGVKGSPITYCVCVCVCVCVFYSVVYLWS